jgi:hypothetical protein
VSPDLDPNDLDEVRRRVVAPVVRALLTDAEVESVDVRRVRRWPSDVEGTWVLVRALAELFSWRLSEDPELLHAGEAAERFYDELQDFIAESRLAWGTLRTGDYVVPPPA